ncbi:MAG TPA: M1 family aminopeptidase [Chitinophagaceae bacterium]|nr:M1 family aminopeptidase [Chitinophagaceae bacterium]
MRTFFLILNMFAAIIVSGQQNIDVLHYKFEIQLSDSSDNIKGRATITVRILKSSEFIELDLINKDSTEKGMVANQAIENGMPVSLEHKNNKLVLKPSTLLRTNEERTFEIFYSGIPKDGLIISKTKYGRRSFFADNWPDRGRNWLPCHDDPADKATVEFIVTAPEHYQVVANGISIEESSAGNGNRLTHWKEETPISTKVMVIGVADFAVNLAGFISDRIPVYSWVYPENKNEVFYDYALAKDILPFYITRVGPYGYKKLANVQSKTRFGGLENANTIFYSENLITGARRSEGTIAHEIAHQWFGNMATEKSFGHLWLSEGFATYFTILYFENKYGKDTAAAMLKKSMAQVIEFSKKSNKPVVDTAEKNYLKLLNANSYQKGGWVLHMLRRELGDSVFWKSIRKYYSIYSGGIAGTEDLQRVFETVSGKNLKQFFKQWLYTPGQPLLDFYWKYDDALKKLKVSIDQKQNQLFHFPITVKIVDSRGKTLYKRIMVSQQSESLVISVKEKPSMVLLDPEVSLLYEEVEKK